MWLAEELFTVAFTAPVCPGSQVWKIWGSVPGFPALLHYIGVKAAGSVPGCPAGYTPTV